MAVQFYNNTVAGTTSVNYYTIEKICHKLQDLLLAAGWTIVGTNQFDFRVFDTVQYYNGSSYTNETNEAKMTGGAGFDMGAATHVTYCGRQLADFNKISIGMTTTTLAAGAAVVEYYAGAPTNGWKAVSNLVDGTIVTGNSLNQSGDITFDMPPLTGNDLWTQTTINGATEFFVRISIPSYTSGTATLQVLLPTDYSTAQPAGGSVTDWTSAAQIYKMNDDLSRTGSSPWYVMVTPVRDNRTVSSGMIKLQTGQGYSGPALTNPGTASMIDSVADITGYTYYSIAAYESGFVICYNLTVNYSYFIGCERARSFTGVLEDPIILYQSSSDSGQITGGSAVGWTGPSYSGNRDSCRVRYWTSGEAAVALMFSIIPSKTYNTDLTNGTYSFSMTTKSQASGITYGPFPYGGGSFGTLRLLAYGCPIDIDNGISQTIIQDGVSRIFHSMNYIYTDDVDKLFFKAKILIATE